MRKCFLMALVAVMLMSQFAYARLFDRLRARRATTNSTAAAPIDSKVTPAPTTSSPPPAPVQPAPAPTTPAPPPPAN
jgi:hypothetical protein